MEDETERPRGYDEILSGDSSWDLHGLRIRWTEPLVPGDVRVHTSQPVRLRVCVESKRELQVPPEDITAWCWTPIVTETNPRGIWKEIQLSYNPRCTQWDDHGITTYVFTGSIHPTKDKTYRVTFNIKKGRILIWNNLYQKDNFVDVCERPSAATQTTVFPSVHFTSNFSDGKEKQCEPKEDDRRRKKEDLEMLVMW